MKRDKMNKTEDKTIIQKNAQKDNLTVTDGKAAGLTKLLHSGFGMTPSFMKDVFIKRQSIVGARYQGGSDELMEDLDPGTKVTFLREPDNKFDRKAIMALDAKGRKIGYIPRYENEFMSPLMDAGKRFYGIVAIDPATAREDSKTPFQIVVDLYMQEFVRPGDMTEIPRQGADGSYVVAHLRVAGNEKHRLWLVYAIRVINGEERGSFKETFSYFDDAPDEEYTSEIRELQEFMGQLPLVIHGYTETIREAIEESWGLALGKPFSNRVIDTKVMADNHLRKISYGSLSFIAQRLGIRVEAEDLYEIRCRQTWELYKRMDKSELEPVEKEEPAEDESYKNELKERLVTECLRAFREKAEEEDMYSAILALEVAVDLGYREDYSVIGTFYLLEEMGHKDIEKGYMWQKRFYDDYVRGNLELKDNHSLISVCNNIATIELWKLIDEYGADGIEASELKAITDYWKMAIEAAEEDPEPEEDTNKTEMLLAMGSCLCNGMIVSEGHENVAIPKDLEYAKRAAKEALRRGDERAREILEEIEEG